jgi:hypothetical protein
MSWRPNCRQEAKGGAKLFSVLPRGNLNLHMILPVWKHIPVMVHFSMSKVFKNDETKKQKMAANDKKPSRPADSKIGFKLLSMMQNSKLRALMSALIFLVLLQWFSKA